MTNRRVVVTGIGAISPVGNDAETGWKNIIEEIGNRAFNSFEC